jgi:hypothetical protein
MDDVPRPPSGLKAPGRRLWAAVVERYVLTAAELSVLVEACRTSDELERAVRVLPELTTLGSTGQLKPHPLLEEVRRHRTLLERLTTALALPDEDQDVGQRGPSRHAQRAARARWGGGRRGVSDGAASSAVG